MSLNNTLLIIQENLNRYFCPICLTLGLIGCLFNILLFSQKQFRTISCCTYFLVASIIMLIALIVGFVPHIYALDKPDPTNTIVIICKLRGYLGQSLSMMYRWLMTMACIDRYMVSSDNVYLREYSNPYMAYRIIIKILIICILFPIHNLFFLNISTDLCIFSNATISFYHSVFTFTFGALFPILIMIGSAILIRSNLVSKQARLQRHILCKNKKNHLINPRDHQVLVMLFIQVIIYIFATIPWMIFLLYGPYGQRIKNKSINRIIIEKFSKYLTEIIIYLYPTLSFYIYTLTSHTFRNGLSHLIFNLFIGRDQSQHLPQSSLLIQDEIGENEQISQSNQIYQFKSIEMKTFLDSSLKTDSSKIKQ